MTTTNTTPAATKPTVRPLSHGAFAVTFPNGATAAIFPVDGGQRFGFSAVHADNTPAGHDTTSSAERAFREAAIAVATAPAALQMDLDTAHALALACDRDTKLFTKTLKRLLHLRTGIRFSVARSTGTASSWVRIKGTGKWGECTTAEHVALAKVFGRQAGASGMSIRPCGGERVWIVCQAIGVGLPEGFKVRAPEWD